MADQTSFITAKHLAQEQVGGVEFEVQRIRLPHSTSRNAVRKLLTDEAEYGGWELVRLRRYRDGTRDAWLRRKIIRVRRAQGLDLR